jgi:hypothetical protein
MNHLKFNLTTVTILVTSFYPLMLLSGIAHADPKPTAPIILPSLQPSRIPPQPNNTVATQKFTSQGTEIFLNGKTLNIPWGQWQVGNTLHTGIGDTALMQQLGVELFNNANYQVQPIDWYGTKRTPTNVTAKLSQQYRYLDITELAKSSGWQWQIVGGKLQLNTPATRVTNVQRDPTPKNGKITVTLDRHTPWKLSQTPTEGYITIEATADPVLLTQLNSPAPIAATNLDPDDDPTAQKLEYKVTSNNQNQTIIQFPIVKGQRARAKLLSPTSLEIRINPNLANIPDREINWAPGLKWRQKWVRLGTNNFPVTYLEIDPRQKGIKLRPMFAAEPNLVGTNHLIKFAPTSQTSQVVAAINGGYFNRNNRMPLGAIKRDGNWLSSPILNRGAIGWNDQGQMRIARLQMQETLITPGGEKLPIISLNSGYVQTGMSRYTSDWGKTYTPLQTDELIVTVYKNTRSAIIQERVTQITPGNAISSVNIPIPADGYLLVLRGQPELSGKMPIGANLRIQRQITPPEFDNYAQVIAAGPWLVQSGKVVLDARSENFGVNFARESAVRSAIGSTSTGNILLITAHLSPNGKGPTLAEMAQLLQQLGTVDALNLDGGSSSSLYLGGQLIDRAAATAARVHNAIGVSLAEP